MVVAFVGSPVTGAVVVMEEGGASTCKRVPVAAERGRGPETKESLGRLAGQGCPSKVPSAGSSGISRSKISCCALKAAQSSAICRCRAKAKKSVIKASMGWGGVGGGGRDGKGIGRVEMRSRIYV